MAHADVTFTFASDLEGWVAGGATHDLLVLSRTTAEGQSGGACVQARATGKNTNPGQSWWEWTGTWEDLGVTPGHVVTSVNGAGSFWSRCSEFTSGHSNNNTSGPLEVRDSAGVLIGTLSAAGLEIGGVNDWTEVTSTAVSIPDHPSDTTIRLRMNVQVRTANTTGAAVTVRQDTIAIVTVHEVAGVDPAEAFGTGTVVAVGAGTGLTPTPAEVPEASGTGVVVAVGSATGSTPQAFDPPDADVTINGTTAELTWSASPTPGVTDYQVFRRTPQTGAPFDPEVDTPVATGITDLFYDDVGLDPGDYDWMVAGRIPA